MTLPLPTVHVQSRYVLRVSALVLVWISHCCDGHTSSESDSCALLQASRAQVVSSAEDTNNAASLAAPCTSGLDCSSHSSQVFDVHRWGHLATSWINSGAQRAARSHPGWIVPGDANMALHWPVACQWFFPVGIIVCFIAFIALVCLCQSQMRATASNAAAEPPKTPAVERQAPLCPTLVSMKSWSVSFSTGALDRISVDGFDLFGQTGLAFLHAVVQETDGNVNLELRIAKPPSKPRAKLQLKSGAIAAQGLDIMGSDGAVYGQLKQVREGEYHVLKDGDHKVLVCTQAKVSVPPESKGDSTALPGQLLELKSPEGQAFATVVRSIDGGQTEVRGQPGADVALVITCTLALLTHPGYTEKAQAGAMTTPLPTQDGEEMRF